MVHGAYGKSIGLPLLLASLVFSGKALALSISGAPPSTAKVGEHFFWVPQVEGANKATLEFAYISRPIWSKDYRSSGAIIGTPTVPGVYSGIRIMAGDGKGFAMTPPFTITVLPASGSGSSSLKISGSPSPAGTVNRYYAFTPTVLAPSGANLTFSIRNKPSWAQFSAESGALTGTPPANDVGTYSGIVIEVADGTLTAALSAFSIAVEAAAPAAKGSVSLEWSRPTANTNGTPLTNLSSYIVRYGTSAGALQSQLTLPGNATQAEITNLSAGTWYFEIASINAQSVESQFSPAVSAVVQ
jgi:hypothetical protein